MSKKNFQTVYGVSIYPIDYLMNEDLTDNDLDNLLNRDKLGLKLSLIIGMFRFIGNTKSNYYIIKLTNSNKWYDKFSWSEKQCKEYEHNIVNVYKNVYQYPYKTALVLAQWFITVYGLKVENNTIDL